MDRLTSLEVFCRVVESGGFSAAARRLGMSVTMVSNHVQALEDRLAARLLNRTTRKVSLTEVGRVYYQRSSQILGELEDADRAAGVLQSKPRGTLRVYTNTPLVRFLAPVISEFLGLSPEVSVDLTTGERMIDMVEEGYDLAIRTLPPPDTSLIVRRLAPWHHIPCCSPGYLATHEAPLHPSDLARHNCLRYTYYPYGNEWHFSDPDGTPIPVRVSGNLVTTAAEAILHQTLAGNGLFMAPSFFVTAEIAAGRLVRVLENFVTEEFAISALYPDRHHLAAKLRSFIDIAVSRFAEYR